MRDWTAGCLRGMQFGVLAQVLCEIVTVWVVGGRLSQVLFELLGARGLEADLGPPRGLTLGGTSTA